jgi:putative CocE/NonD family hydrolase
VSTPQVTIDYDVQVPMQDGTYQAADVFRPAAAGRYPALLMRTPYNKLSTPTTGHLFFFDFLAAVRAGYAVVVQDVRGRYASEGRFRHFEAETADGGDSITWLAGQEWCDGTVGLFGGSYAGATQYLAMLSKPAAVKAMVPALTASEYYEGWIYQGGAFQLGFALSWAVAMAYADLLIRERRGEDVSEGREGLEAVAGDIWSAYRRLPLVEPADESAPWLGTYRDWLEHPDRDSYWQATAINERHSELDVPALHIAGWNDIFLKGSLENFTGMRASAATEQARANQRLIVTPWGHSAGHVESVGQLWYGPAAEYVYGPRPFSASDTAPVDVAQECIDWFDSQLKGDQAVERDEVVERDPVRIFVMGANRWRDEPDWPLTRAKPTRWYLRGSGGLSQAPPTDTDPDDYAYDPRDPVPTAGGQTLLPGGGFFVGPHDRRAIEARADVLTYTSSPLLEDLEVTGPVLVTLHVATSALDTDFTAALVDVYPDGRAIGIADGILRMRYRDGTSSAKLLDRHRVYRIEVDLTATSNVFFAGHRIRIEISSSNFPRFDRNPNNGGLVARARESDLEIARQLVFLDSDRASFVTLPVIP